MADVKNQDTSILDQQMEQQADQQGGLDTKGAGAESSESENADSGANTDALMAEIARMRVSEQKMKKELDKALKEKGEVTKALRAKQTAAELEDEARNVCRNGNKSGGCGSFRGHGGPYRHSTAAHRSDIKSG